MTNPGNSSPVAASNNGVYKSLGISTFSNFEFDFSFVAGNESGYVLHPDLATFVLIYLDVNGGITFTLQKSGNTQVQNSVKQFQDLGNLSGKKIFAKIIFNNGKIEYEVRTGNEEWISSGILTSTDTSFTPYFSYLVFSSYHKNSAFAYDLNDVRFYNNGSLVYQPCLKIPYTESKTGSKIVDPVYYERVKDVSEQNFAQKYYIFDNKNGKVRQPIGEIYGMIENLRKLIMERTS